MFNTPTLNEQIDILGHEEDERNHELHLTVVSRRKGKGGGGRMPLQTLMGDFNLKGRNTKQGPFRENAKTIYLLDGKK